jgi:hypothetical protein
LVDYTRATGSAGTLIIRDEDGWVSFWVRCDDASTNVGSVSWSGKANGNRSGTFSWSSGGGTRRIGGPWQVSTSQTVSFGIGGTGTMGLGGPTSFSVAINRAAPTAPFGLSVTRVSDSQQTLNWSRFGGYSSQIIQRREASGFGYGAWQQIASVNGTATSYSDRSTRSGRRYEYRVAAKAPSGQSGWSNAADIYTTPDTPTGASASRSGSNIVVTVGTQGYAGSFDIRDGATVVASNVSIPWTHVSPDPGVSHTYTVRGRRGSLVSAYSAPSNTVQLLAPPSAPTGLSPNGGMRASDLDVSFAWSHNPVDSSPQTEYELRYRDDPEAAWTTLSGTTEATRAVALDVGEFEWQVRTKGEHASFSAWSATATVEVIDRPGVAVTSPEGTWDSSVLPVTWSWYQPQDLPQSSWQARLLDGLGDTVETRSGSGSAGAVTFNHRLTEGEWTVEVRGATGDVWSEWASALLVVTFVPPAPPTVAGVWDDTQGGVLLSVGPGVPGAAVQGEDGAWYAVFPAEGTSNIGFDDGHPFIADEEDEALLFDGPQVMVFDEDPPETVSVALERSLDGEEWEPVAVTEESVALIDWEAWSFGDVKYRATAFTAEGAAAVVNLTVECRSEHIWLSGGAGFGKACRLPYDPSVSISAGRARALKQYAGRSLPVAYSGEAVSRTVAVSGTTAQRSDESATVDDLVDVVQSEADTFMFRDPDGRRIYGSVSQMDLPRQSGVVDDDGFNAFWGYSFTLTETEPR